jgi:hypothetical protein
MAKFGLMAANGEHVLQEFEGDWLEVNGDVVLVMSSEGGEKARALHIIRMLPGWVIKKTG